MEEAEGYEVDNGTKREARADMAADQLDEIDDRAKTQNLPVPVAEALFWVHSG
jgi:hypothetical protein